MNNPDPRPHRRFLLALALAIAVHEIAIGAMGFLRVEHDQPERRTAPTQIVLEMHAPPLPTPEPSARPVPEHTPPPVATPSTRRDVAAPKAVAIARTQQSGGSRGGERLEVHDPAAGRQSRPIWWAAPHGSKVAAASGSETAPTAGPAAGTTEGAGAGNGTGDASGSGSGAGGSGSGATNAEVPCGEPVFYGLRALYNRADGSFDEDVRVQLRLENGQKLIGDFHYPWHYPSETENPFSPRYNGSAAIPAQLPPPGYLLSREPLAVQLTLKFTLPNGLTRFAPCP